MALGERSGLGGGRHPTPPHWNVQGPECRAWIFLLSLGPEAVRLDSKCMLLRGDGTSCIAYPGLHRRIGSDGLVSGWTTTKGCVHTTAIPKNQNETIGVTAPFVCDTHHTPVSAFSFS